MSGSSPRKAWDPTFGRCEEKIRLLDEFLAATRAMMSIQNEQARAVLAGDPDFLQFEVLIRRAQQKKDSAKYAWMDHIGSHGCWKRAPRESIEPPLD